MEMELLLKLLIVGALLFLGNNWFFSSKRSLIKKAVVIFLLVGMIVAQQINDHKITYPLANWSMYSQPFPANHYKEYVLVNSDGEKLHYPFELVNNVNQRPFMRKVSAIDDENLRVESDVVNENLESTLEKLVNIYQKYYPNAEIVEFKINVVQFETNESDSLVLHRINSHSHKIE